MRVAIAGAHGQVALALAQRLVSAGDEVIGLIRNPDHTGDLEQRRVQPRVCDLERSDEEEIAAAIGGADAVVFAAGAGPGSGAERKLTLDRDGAIKLLHAAERAGAGRYVIVSSVGAEDPPGGEEVFAVYLRAKAEADQAVQASHLEWTVVRPGHLTDAPGTGRVSLGVDPIRGEVSREDVAAVLEAVLRTPQSAGQTLYVNGGEDPVDRALAAALADS